MSAQQTNLGIVVGVDGSPCSHTAVEWAARDAQMRNVALRVVQVVPPVITAPEGWAFEYSRFQEAKSAKSSNTRTWSPKRTKSSNRPTRSPSRHPPQVAPRKSPAKCCTAR